MFRGFGRCLFSARKLVSAACLPCWLDGLLAGSPACALAIYSWNHGFESGGGRRGGGEGSFFFSQLYRTQRGLILFAECGETCARFRREAVWTNGARGGRGG